MVTTYRPATLQEALSLRGRYHPIPFAGGTDLMVKYHHWDGTLPRFPTDVLFLGHLQELKGLEKLGKTLVIGAGVTLSEVATFPSTPELLREAVLSIAAPGIRNIATLAGNICNASPAGDSICALTTLDASVSLASESGTRTVPLATFITGPGRTDLKPGELLISISVPLETWDIHVFKKVGTRKANALAKLSFAAAARVQDGIVNRVALSFGAVAPTVVRSGEMEKRLAGKTVSEIADGAEEIVRDYGTMIVPIDDQRSTAVYRKQVALNLLRNFLVHTLQKEAR